MKIKKWPASFLAGCRSWMPIEQTDMLLDNRHQGERCARMNLPDANINQIFEGSLIGKRFTSQ